MFSTRLRILRQQYGLTQSELAKQLGVSTSTIGMYEQGRREPDHKTLLIICKLFGISTDYLLGSEKTIASSESNDFNAIIDGFERTLLEQEGLMFNGVMLERDDVKKIVDAMKIGAEMATRSSSKRGKNSGENV
ncbi:MAG: helix-turn-helix transcriptional regulator [Oscillospiraceae bacterium]|nr:helix-turn-helix transcriptional regulator [Oscillospiraceae bacterium]